MDTPNAPNPHFVQLAASSKDAADQAFDLLLAPVGMLASTTHTPEAALGIVQALFRLATALAHATIGTQLDVQMRSTDDAGALASAHWKAAGHLHQLVIAELLKQGIEPPVRLKRLADAVGVGNDDGNAELIASLPNGEELAKAVAKIEAMAQAPEPTTPTTGQEMATLLRSVNSKGGVS